jgi:hypothetical protein
MTEDRRAEGVRDKEEGKEEKICIRQIYKKINYIWFTSSIEIRDKPQMSFVLLIFTDVSRDKCCVI